MLSTVFAAKPPFIATPPRKTLGWLKRSCAVLLGATMMVPLSGPASTPAAAQQPAQKPNIIFIMGDDIGWMQPSIYHRGLMVGETPNIDRIGNEGAIFMDYCRHAELHFRPQCLLHGHVSAAHRHDTSATARAARPICGPARRRSPNSCSISATTPASSARTIWATTPTSLPTAHGFQEYWGYLYHLDAMQQRELPGHQLDPDPQACRAAVQEHADSRCSGGPRRGRSEDDALPDASAPVLCRASLPTAQPRTRRAATRAR